MNKFTGKTVAIKLDDWSNVHSKVICVSIVNSKGNHTSISMIDTTEN